MSITTKVIISEYPCEEGSGSYLYDIRTAGNHLNIQESNRSLDSSVPRNSNYGDFRGWTEGNSNEFLPAKHLSNSEDVLGGKLQNRFKAAFEGLLKGDFNTYRVQSGTSIDLGIPEILIGDTHKFKFLLHNSKECDSQFPLIIFKCGNFSVFTYANKAFVRMGSITEIGDIPKNTWVSYEFTIDRNTVESKFLDKNIFTRHTRDFNPSSTISMEGEGSNGELYLKSLYSGNDQVEYDSTNIDSVDFVSDRDWSTYTIHLDPQEVLGLEVDTYEGTVPDKIVGMYDSDGAINGIIVTNIEPTELMGYTRDDLVYGLMSNGGIDRTKSISESTNLVDIKELGIYVKRLRELGNYSTKELTELGINSGRDWLTTSSGSGIIIKK